MATPYKCPCCDGWGTRINPSLGSLYDSIKCPACSGSGVIWDFLDVTSLNEKLKEIENLVSNDIDENINKYKNKDKNVNIKTNQISEEEIDELVKK